MLLIGKPLLRALLVSCLAWPAGALAQAPPPASAGLPLALRQIALLELGGAPGNMNAASAGGMIIISNTAWAGEAKVAVFDPVRRRVIGHIPGIIQPRGIASDEIAKQLYIADAAASSVAVVSYDGWKLARRIAVPVPPGDIALGGNMLWIASARGNDLYGVPLDAANASNAQTTKFDAGGRISGIAYDAASHRLFASLNDRAAVAVIDTQTPTAAPTIWKLAASEPTGIAADATTGHLFVAVRYAVLSLDLATGRELSRAPAAAGADTLRLASLHLGDKDDLPTNDLDAAQSSQSATPKNPQPPPAPNTLWVGATDGTIALLAISSSGILSPEVEFHSDVRGSHFAYDPERHSAFLPGGRNGKARLAIIRAIAAGSSH
jgi:DNA-binding beta-propeller fold protein YncE